MAIAAPSNTDLDDAVDLYAGMLPGDAYSQALARLTHDEQRQLELAGMDRFAAIDQLAGIVDIADDLRQRMLDLSGADPETAESGAYAEAATLLTGKANPYVEEMHRLLRSALRW